MDNQEIKNIQQNFLEELKTASSGEKTSLPFIIHQLPEQALVSDREIFQVIVIGGSVCKKALVKKEAQNLKILQQADINPENLLKNQDLPSFIEKELDPDTKVLALHFAYPLKPVLENGRLDGILISGSKEYEFKGLVGKKIGEEIENYISQKQGRKISVSVANDTICLLLSGLTKYKWDQLVAGVVGTGVNFAFFLDEKKLVNLESRNFNNFEQSEEAKQLDQETNHPGKGLFEKEVSGAYLYKLFNITLKNQNLNHQLIASTKELNELISNSDEQISSLAKKLLTRSANLVAGQIGGIALFKQKNLVFIMEGSLFWEGVDYQKTITNCLKQTLPDLNIEFVKIADSAILGAAKLVA